MEQSSPLNILTATQLDRIREQRGIYRNKEKMAELLSVLSNTLHQSEARIVSLQLAISKLEAATARIGMAPTLNPVEAMRYVPREVVLNYVEDFTRAQAEAVQKGYEELKKKEEAVAAYEQQIKTLAHVMVNDLRIPEDVRTEIAQRFLNHSPAHQYS